MKLEDVYIGQRVGFPYEGKSLVGVVTDLKNTPKDGEDRWIATVESYEVIWHVNIKRLLGVVEPKNGIVEVGVTK